MYWYILLLAVIYSAVCHTVINGSYDEWKNAEQ